MGYNEAFLRETRLINQVGLENAYLVWVMGKYLDDSSLDSLASIALTDGPNDKKIDFISLDLDGKRLVFAQGYYSDKGRDSAPANKASDLNTAVAWLFSGDQTHIPTNLREAVQDARAAIESEEIDTIELLYVHNLPESVNVARELQTVEEHLRRALSSPNISVRAKELGSAQTQHIHDAQESHIDVKDLIEFPSRTLREEKGPTWTAYVASVPGVWLHTIYTKFSDRLFSANYRGFLGGGRRRRVNIGIHTNER